jgi:hypothetical protein
VTILREQAALLGQKTRQQVLAEVETRNAGEMLVHSFVIVVPALDNYKYELFKVQHGVPSYPLSVASPGLTGKVTSQAAFVDVLGKILSSENTRNVIQSLLAQVGT